MTDKRLFKEFLESPEDISTNILAERLKRLEAPDRAARHPYSKKPLRYEYRLTRKGADLLPIMQQLCRWGNRTIKGTWTLPAYFTSRTPKDLMDRLAK